MWFFAMTYQNHTKNRDGKDSFYTKFFGIKVIRPPRAPFGSLAYPLEPKTQRAHKMSSKSQNLYLPRIQLNPQAHVHLVGSEVEGNYLQNVHGHYNNTRHLPGKDLIQNGTST